MQKLALLGSFILLFCTLTACSNNSGYDQTQLNENLLKETWAHQINLNSSSWVSGADSWYFTGDPNSIEKYNHSAPPSKAITTLMVRVPDFTQVSVAGDFQVQISGKVDHNSVFIVGPNASTRQISVEILNNTLYIHKVKDSKDCLRNVIVRINIHDLQVLKNFGSSNIYGRDILSNHLIIRSCDCGNIFLSGDMNLTNINQTGSGKVVVLGATTPSLKVKVNGKGSVKVNGHVGIQSIFHRGDGEVSILGADSDSLVINTYGMGITSVVGYVNLKKISANNNSRVYIYWTNSNSLYITASGKARIGLAGAVTNMNLDITDASRFEGQYLHGNTVYARTRNGSHANISSDKKIFAAALDSSSIYIFGSPTMVSRYTSQKGAIIPIWIDAPPPMPSPPAIAYPQRHGYKGE